MEKIVIIGGNGSGKTTFARQLSSALNIPVIFMDRIYWTDNWERADEGKANAELKSEMQKSKWIIDGNHTSTIPDRLEACDTVFYFDFSTAACFFGSLKRTVRNYGVQRDDVGGNNNIEKLDKKKIAFLKSVLRFNKQNRRLYYKMIDEASAVHLIVFKNRKQADDYLCKLKDKQRNE